MLLIFYLLIPEAGTSEATTPASVEIKKEKPKTNKSSEEYIGLGGKQLPKHVLDNITMFQKKQQSVRVFSILI